MEEYPLVRRGDTQQVADFGAVETLDIAECEDLALSRRELRQEFFDVSSESFGGDT